MSLEKEKIQELLNLPCEDISHLSITEQDNIRKQGYEVVVISDQLIQEWSNYFIDPQDPNFINSSALKRLISLKNKTVRVFTDKEINKLRSKLTDIGFISQKTGIWNINTGPSQIVENGAPLHKMDKGLATALLTFLEEQTEIVDFGCGNADYAKILIENGKKVDCYDGNPYTPEMTNGLGKILDLTEKFDLNKKYECVICLEVGEHIPPEHEQIFLDNLDRHCEQCLILSWALPGQGGDGHVNEKDKDYVVKELSKRGYKEWNEASEFFKNSSTFGWFKETIIVFTKK